MTGGQFISFEGGEGVGKSTQSRLLRERLMHTGIEAIETREPGGSPGAEEIRDYLHLDVADAGYCVRRGAARALGTRGGVPARAGKVDLAETLDKYYPDLAAQVREPRLLLLPPAPDWDWGCVGEGSRPAAANT